MKSPSDKTTKTNIHSGHRQRVKERFLKSGIDSFQHHEILEFLLFFGIPYKDTNPLAHELINKYGSFSAVFDAPIESLKQVPGMTDNAAVLLKSFAPISGVYMQDKVKNTLYLGSLRTCVAFLKTLFFSAINEEVYVICLDNAHKLISYKKIATGTVNELPLLTRQVQEVVFFSNAANIILAHNHPSGVTEPSNADIAMTRNIIESLSYINVNLLDHVIVAGDKHFSFSRSGLLDECKNNFFKHEVPAFAENNINWLLDD